MEMADSEHLDRRGVPGAALDYLLERLWLARELEEPLRDQLSAGSWESWAIAPDAAPAERSERFAAGWGVRSAALPTATILEAMANLGAAAVWLVPDPLARPGDPFLATCHLPYLTSDAAVYHACRSPSAHEILATWQAAGSAVGCIGVVTTLAEQDPLASADLREAARDARLVVAEAYDGEGFLCCSRVSG